MELERRLTRQFPGMSIEVLNAGADAYSTAHSLVNIQFRLVELNPDVILLMENINDSSVNYFGRGATPDYSNKYLQSYFLNPNLQGTRSFTGFLTQSRFLTKFGLPQMLANKPRAIHPENDFRYGLHLFSRNLSTIAAVCNLSNIELVLMSQPSSLKPDPSVSEEAFLAYNDEMENVATKEGIQFIDMYSLMGHGERFFVDKVHYSVEGVERFAEIVCSQLVLMVPRLRERQTTGSLLLGTWNGASYARTDNLDGTWAGEWVVRLESRRGGPARWQSVRSAKTRSTLARHHYWIAALYCVLSFSPITT